ncbi:unnamed protein product, partial [Mesorhabditis spiculigera]
MQLRLAVFALLCAPLAAIWIGEEYWTVIDYLGNIRDGKTTADFLTIPNADGSEARGWVAYWITRTKYGSGHYEAFGHAIRRADGRVCGYFVGQDDEVVEVCGGFRVLSRSRQDAQQGTTFRWVSGRETNSYDAVGFTNHKIASFTNGTGTSYGDGQLPDRGARQFKGVFPENYDDIIKADGYEFDTRVHFLRKSTAERGPERTGAYLASAYSDPHVRHAEGWAGHPGQEPRQPENHQQNVPSRPGCTLVKTRDGNVFEVSCPQQQPASAQVDPNDARLKDPRTNPSYEYYDPMFDPRSSLYDGRYNPYDSQYDPEMDRMWRAANIRSDGQKPAPPRGYDPRTHQQRLRPNPPAGREVERPVRVLRPGPVIPAPAGNGQQSLPAHILSPGVDRGLTVVDYQGNVYRKQPNSDNFEQEDRRPSIDIGRGAAPNQPVQPEIGGGSEPDQRPAAPQPEEERPEMGAGAGPAEVNEVPESQEATQDDGELPTDGNDDDDYLLDKTRPSLPEAPVLPSDDEKDIQLEESKEDA